MAQDELPWEREETKERRHGPARAAVERTLTAWRRGGHLIGPEFAALARSLRDSADAVDEAHASMEPVPYCPVCHAPAPKWIKPGAPYSLAFANKIHAELLLRLQPVTAGDTTDPYGATDDDDYQIPADWFGDAAPGDAVGHPEQ